MLTTGPDPDFALIQQIELQALHEIALLIGRATDLDHTLRAILKILHETLHMERATLSLVDRTGGRLRIRTSYGLTKEEEERGVYSIGEGITGQVFKSAQPFVVPDIKDEPLFLNKTGSRNSFLLKKDKISFIGVPVILNGETVGVLSVDRLFAQDVSFEEDIRFLTVVAALTAQFLNLHQAIYSKQEHLIEENRSLKAELHARYKYPNIVAVSKIMQDVLVTVEKAAPTRATVLIMGESGTGKELIARAIHEGSQRQKAPFIKINCAAIPETLLESEFFGHEKGAFTGAFARKKGRFEMADKGTLFLDEIGELPLSLQAKLLRALQEQEFERVGGSNTVQVDVRVIAATNRGLDAAVADGTFRADLYYRLNVVPIVIPPLRNRVEDIPPIVDHFLRQYNLSHHKNVKLSRQALDILISYDWPGNVRELQNLIERLLIMTESDCIQPEELPFFISNTCPVSTIPCLKPMNQTQKSLQQEQSSSPSLSLKEIEKRQILAALIKHKWVQTKAAKELGLTPRQIGYKIQKYNLVQL